jgi:hypothetical protein
MIASLTARKKIWIDLDNSPHVPFFAPIIGELQTRGYTLLLTARDCFQVCDLASLLRIPYKRIGRHYGKNAVRKIAGLGLRALQLVPTALQEKPDLAVSHGSRSQLLVSRLLGIPSLILCDYEFARVWLFIRPTWVLIPEVIPESSINIHRHRILKYPGIKEDVYVPRFRADAGLRAALGLGEDEVVVTLRPPASEAHYHNPQSDELFRATVDFLGRQPHLRIVLLPRNERQALAVRHSWPQLVGTGKMIVLEQIVDGLNLIWQSDLVISGGGTMNREAAALGVPVYSIYRGKIGAVDRYLAATGRLTLLESVEELEKKVVLARRPRLPQPRNLNGASLQTVVNNIVAVVESRCRA